MRFRSLFDIVVCALISGSGVCYTQEGDALKLWYRQPAAASTQALPVGNGRLAAMVFGIVGKEHVQLNEDPLWSGEKRDRSNPEAPKAVLEIRRLLMEGHPAQALVDRTMISIPRGLPVYETLGDLWLDFGVGPDATDYWRELDLDTGMVTVRYTAGGGDAVPIDGAQYGIWPMGGAWLSIHLAEHYDFTRDRKFLAERAYPVMKEAAQFFLDYLVDDGKGHLVTGPSLSQENTYRTASGERAALTMGPAMDTEILQELFGRLIEASEVPKIDPDFAREVEMHRPDGVPDAAQQVKHGALLILAQFKNIGHSIRGTHEPDLRQYTHLGDGSTKTDGRIYDPKLGPNEAKGEYSGKPDDRWISPQRTP